MSVDNNCIFTYNIMIIYGNNSSIIFDNIMIIFDNIMIIIDDNI